MNATRSLVCLIALAAPCALAGDDAAPASAASFARHPEGLESLPRFAIFGWASPPPGLEGEERYAELAAAGFNLVLPALDDTGGYAPSLPQLDLAAPHGLRCLAWDPRFEQVPTSADPRPIIAEIVSDYRDHPAFGGYYLGDEPFPDAFNILAFVHATLREMDPAHPGWNNLIGRQYFSNVGGLESYTRDYIDRVEPAVLCNDHYDFLPSGDRGQFIENAVTLNALARERGIPFWSVVQLTEHTGFRGLRDGELKWQVGMLLAYGARGIGYFTYWTPPPDPRWNWQPAVIAYDGRRTRWYKLLTVFNPRVGAAGETLAGLVWVLTEHAGWTPAGGRAFAPDEWIASVEGRAAIGRFIGPDGRRYLLVVNSDSLSARTIALALPGTQGVRRLGDAIDAWTPVPGEPGAGDGLAIDVPLEAGDFALLELEGAPAPGATPGLAVRPQPARGECVLAVRSARQGGRLEIVDGLGRVVWRRTLGEGTSSIVWRGETNAGEPLPPGVYFARVEDRQGAAVSRLVWLGR